jgi:uncharacterized protein YdeI (YjbR/CyaY-like superfamily)
MSPRRPPAGKAAAPKPSASAQPAADRKPAAPRRSRAAAPAKPGEAAAPRVPAPEAALSDSQGGLPIIAFAEARAFEAWLEGNHRTASGLWVKLAKTGRGAPSLTYPEAVDAALCFGWIDGQKAGGEDHWLQKFTPRGRNSLWSKRNRERVEALRAAGRMRPPGETEVERARADGRWDRAYDSPRTAAVPPDLQAELDKSKTAAAFFAGLNGTNRYAILWRLQTAKKPETRAKRLRDLVAMLKRKEKLYP